MAANTEKRDPLLDYSRNIDFDSIRLDKSNTDQLNIIAFGVTGHGKSTFLNFISKEELFETSQGVYNIVSCTKEAKSHLINLPEPFGQFKILKVTDTPGLFDTERLEREQDRGVEEEKKDLFKELLRAFLEGGRYISAFVFIVSFGQKWSLEMKSALDLLNRVNFSWEHTIVVATHGDKLSKNAEEMDLKFREFLQNDARCPQQLKDLCTKVQNRVLVVNSTSTSNNDPDKCLRKLVHTVMDIVDRKGMFQNEYYLHAQYQVDEAIHGALSRAYPERLSIQERQVLIQPACLSLCKAGEEFAKARNDLIFNLVRVKDFFIAQPSYSKGRSVGSIAASVLGVAGGIASIALAPVSGGTSLLIGGIPSALIGAGGGAFAYAPIWNNIQGNAVHKSAQSVLNSDQQALDGFYQAYTKLKDEISLRSLKGHVTVLSCLAENLQSETISTFCPVAITVATALRKIDLLHYLRKYFLSSTEELDAEHILYEFHPIPEGYRHLSGAHDFGLLASQAFQFLKEENQQGLINYFDRTVAMLENEATYINELCNRLQACSKDVN